jgi:hypothetical protein
VSPKPRNVRLQATVKYGFWIRTKLDPIRAVKWAPETLPDGRTRVNGRCWQEILASGATHEPEHFLGVDVTPAPATEPMPYAPAPGEPVCGWRLAQEAPGGARQYCPRSVVPGELCTPHAAAYAAIHQGEETP